MEIANDSFLGWCRFALARDFTADDRTIYLYPQTTVEKCGRALRWGVGSALDLVLREIKNPIMIVALTAIAAVIVTIAFYPAVIFNAIVTVLPFVALLEPWMAKMALYILLQTTLFGVGVRAYGRFQNTNLMQAWRENRLTPLFIGTKQRT